MTVLCPKTKQWFKHLASDLAKYRNPFVNKIRRICYYKKPPPLGYQEKLATSLNLVLSSREGYTIMPLCHPT